MTLLIKLGAWRAVWRSTEVAFVCTVGSSVGEKLAFASSTYSRVSMVYGEQGRKGKGTCKRKGKGKG